MKHRNTIRRLSMLSFAGAIAFGASTVSAGDALSTSIGPVALAPAPIRFCVGQNCKQTPSLGTVTLAVSVKPDHLLGVLPKLTPVKCPWPQSGAAVLVQANTSDSNVSAAISGNASFKYFADSIGPTRLAANRSLLLSACTF